MGIETTLKTAVQQTHFENQLQQQWHLLDLHVGSLLVVTLQQQTFWFVSFQLSKDDFQRYRCGNPHIF